MDERGCKELFSVKRGMCPAVAGGTTPPQPVVDLSDVRESAVGRPLSVGGGPELFPKMDPRTRKTSASVTRSIAAGTVTPQDQRDVSSSDDDLWVDSQSVILDDRGVDVAPLVGRPEATRPPPEAGCAIVVGAVVSAAPWFLTGWAHEVEVEIMIAK